MIYGAHALVYSRAPAEARALLDIILEGGNRVDAGGGWLVFALPPAEIAIQPTDGAPGIELYFMCQDIEKTILQLREKGVKFSRPVREESWGRVCAIAVPGGGEVGLYQPRHATPLERPGSRKAPAKPVAARRQAAGSGRARRG